MKNQKLIIGAFITLVVLNLVLIGLLFFGRPCHRGHDGPREHKFHSKDGKHHGPGRFDHLSVFSKKLDLNEEQEKKFTAEIDSFHSEMKKIMDEKIELKKQLLKPGPGNESEALLDKIAAAERASAALELKHFALLKNILSEEQKIKFDTIVSKMNSFRGPGGSHFKHGRD